VRGLVLEGRASLGVGVVGGGVSLRRTVGKTKFGQVL